MPTTTTHQILNETNNSGTSSVIIIGITISSAVFLIFLFLMCKSWFKTFKENNRHEPTAGNFCKYVILRRNDNRIAPENNQAFKQAKSELDFLFKKFYTEQVKLTNYGITELITDYNDQLCPVCNNTLTGVVCRTNCGHLYHKSCLIELLRDDNNTCFTCRQSIVS